MDLPRYCFQHPGSCLAWWVNRPQYRNHGALSPLSDTIAYGQSILRLGHKHIIYIYTYDIGILYTNYVSVVSWCTCVIAKKVALPHWTLGTLDLTPPAQPITILGNRQEMTGIQSLVVSTHPEAMSHLKVKQFNRNGKVNWKQCLNPPARTECAKCGSKKPKNYGCHLRHAG